MKEDRGKKKKLKKENFLGLLISVRKAGVLCKGRFGVLLGNRHFKHTQGYQKIKKFWLGEKGKGCVLTESFVFW